MSFKLQFIGSVFFQLELKKIDNIVGITLKKIVGITLKKT